MIGIGIGIGIAGVQMRGAGGVLPFTDAFTRADGAIGNGWAGSTWAISGSRAVNTPTLGAEMIANGAFTTDTAGWSAGGAATLSVVAGQSGNGLQVENSAGGGFGLALQSLTTVVGAWYQLTLYHKNGNQQGHVRIGTSFGGAQILQVSMNDLDWTLRTFVFRATTTTTWVRLGVESSTALQTTLFDTVALAPLATSTLFATVDAGQTDCDVAVEVTLSTAAAQRQAGVVVNLDSVTTPVNFVIGYHDGTNAYLDKYVAGTRTVLVSAAASYVAGALVRVTKSGTTYKLYYNGSQVGIDQTISDASIVGNTRHGMFSTVVGNGLDDFALALT